MDGEGAGGDGKSNTLSMKEKKALIHQTLSAYDSQVKNLKQV